ncbi:MAG: hypothetical protein HY812_18155 [Planctomycetes bacterium]|nr:hypothetical protein [Planctomycetota bacterium]
MKDLLSRFGSRITGKLSGFDRLVFRGTLIPLVCPRTVHRFRGGSGLRPASAYRK